MTCTPWGPPMHRLITVNENPTQIDNHAPGSMKPHSPVRAHARNLSTHRFSTRFETLRNRCRRLVCVRGSLILPRIVYRC